MSDIITVEQEYLGSLILDQRYVLESRLKTESFKVGVHGILFEKMRSLSQTGGFSIAQFSDIEDRVKIDGVDYSAMEYAQMLCEHVIVTVNAPSLEQIIQQDFEKRELLRLLSDLAISGKKPAEIKSELAKYLESSEIPSNVMTETQLHKEIVDTLDRPNNFYSTGLPTLDQAMGGGFYEGFTYGFAGKEKAGKTCLAQTISFNLARSEIKHAYIALEMGSKQIQQRNYARVLGINSLAFLEPSEAVKQQVKKINPKDYIYFMDAPGYELSEILNTISSLQIKEKITGFVLDYWQLVSGGNYRDTEERHLRQVAQAVSDFARKRKLWCMILAQQNQDGKLFGGNGLRKACDQLYFIEQNDDIEESPPRRWIRMDASRYTPLMNIGSENGGGLILNVRAGPYFEERVY